MAIDWDTGSDTSSGNLWLDQDGWYHLAVEAASEYPTKNDGTLIDNALFRLDCRALAGTAPKCEDKNCDITLYAPSSTHKDGGEFAHKKIDRTLIALNVIDPQDRNKRVEIDVSKFEGQQFLVKLSKREGYRRLDLDGANIYHVDDPEATHVPRNAKALKLIPPEHRRIGGRPAVPPTTKPAAKPVDVDSLADEI